MKLIVMFMAAALALAGCSTISKIDTEIQKNVAQFCASAAQTQAVFLAASAAIPAAHVERVNRAYAAVESICANQATANTATVTAAVTNYILAVKAARKAAKE